MRRLLIMYEFIVLIGINRRYEWWIVL